MKHDPLPSHSSSTVHAHEIQKFEAHTTAWDEQDGPLAILSRLNPTRLTFIQDHLKRLLGLDCSSQTPYEGLNMLDIGCGTGLITEPMARLGATITGIDASEVAITQARTKAISTGLDITYRTQTIEHLAREDQKFDVIFALEVIEHVNHLDQFFQHCVHVLKPGGIGFISTLNRTVSSYFKAIVLAEYVLKWVPKGTHSWQQFVKPSECATYLLRHGAYITDFKGIDYKPLSKEWELSQHLDTNYIGCFLKK